MDRDVTVIVGQTGFGKSLWAKVATRNIRRMLAYDPAASFPVEYIGGEEVYERLIESSEPPEVFRYGTIYAGEDLTVMGCAAFIVGRCTLLIEEASTVWKKGERINGAEGWIGRDIFLGRHQSVSLIVLAQRATSIPIDLRSQADRTISFRQVEQDDLDGLRGKLGERVKELPTLAKWDCIDSHNGVVSRYNIAALCERTLGIKLDRTVGKEYAIPPEG